MSQHTLVGNTLGNYLIERLIGEGGMGAVYLARHQLIGYKAAIKVLLPHFCNNQHVVQRFFNEARATTAIEHPSIVKVLDFGYRKNGSAYIVMEFLDGEPLDKRLRRVGHIAVNDALRIVRQVASALSAAHTCGVIHRDLKPDNIFLIRDPEIEGGERVKILDFGIAKLGGTDSDPSVLKTQSGTILGTPQYMAPEQCCSAPDIDHRADIYSLGCVFFHLVCGRPPFVGMSLGQLLLAQMQNDPPAPSSLEPSIPADVESLILRALAKKPDDRFSSMAEMAKVLESVYRLRITGMHSLPGAHSGPIRAITAGHDARTTMSGSAAQVMASDHRPARRFNRVIQAALAITLFAVAGVGIWFARSRDSSASELPPVEPDIEAAASPGAAPADTARASTSDPPVAEKQPAKEPSEEPAAVNHERDIPATIAIGITSIPPDAEVTRQSDGVIVGNTPYSDTIEPGSGEQIFRVEKSGYEPAEVVFAGDEEGSREVRLHATSHATRSRHKKSSGTSRRHSDEDVFGYR